ncbi:MAG: hypothetical protein R3C11_04775 [Planctomycetaceae bacterium]
MSADASHEADYKVRVKEVGETTFLPDSSIEIIHAVDLAEPPVTLSSILTER